MLCFIFHVSSILATSLRVREYNNDQAPCSMRYVPACVNASLINPLEFNVPLCIPSCNYNKSPNLTQQIRPTPECLYLFYKIPPSPQSQSRQQTLHHKNRNNNNSPKRRKPINHPKELVNRRQSAICIPQTIHVSRVPRILGRFSL